MYRLVGRVIKSTIGPSDTNCASGESCISEKYCASGTTYVNGVCTPTNGVSSGDGYRSSHPSSRDRDHHSSTSNHSVKKGENWMGIGSLVITLRPIDPTCIGFTYCHRYFTSTSGLFVYIFSQPGLNMSTFLTVPHEYQIFFNVHGVVFRDEIVFRNFCNMTHQQLVLSMYPGVGTLIEQPHYSNY